MKTTLSAALVLMLFSVSAHGFEEKKEPPPDRSTAVALNYCRAAFYRIKQNPSKQVLLEEQEKILNNINLNEIADQEVVSLYTSVLDEIGSETIAVKEREVLKHDFNKQLGKKIVANAFLMSTQVSSLQFGQAVRTGAGSWWDYRNLSDAREIKEWQIDKARLSKLVGRSSSFMDTFWKMAKKKNIPDHWLIRNADLDKLDEALAEKDPEVRLRRLVRLEKFMECYPPYWYRVARDQQAAGKLAEAGATYERLAELGTGHFRRDEMLAAGVANLAVIQEHQKNPLAARTARQALGYSSNAWQANLVSARVLSRHGFAAEAEDAILRNLDSKLERKQSLVALVSVFQEHEKYSKLAHWMQDEQVVRDLSGPMLVRIAGFLGTERTPAVAARQLVQSLYGYADLNFGQDDVVLSADPNWNIETASIRLTINGRPARPPRIVRRENRTEVRFEDVSQLGGIFASAPRRVAMKLSLEFPDTPPIQLSMNRLPAASVASVWRDSGRRAPWTMTRRGNGFLVTKIHFEASRIALLGPGSATTRKTLVKSPDENPATKTATAEPRKTKPRIVPESVTPVDTEGQ